MDTIRKEFLAAVQDGLPLAKREKTRSPCPINLPRGRDAFRAARRILRGMIHPLSGQRTQGTRPAPRLPADVVFSGAPERLCSDDARLGHWAGIPPHGVLWAVCRLVIPLALGSAPFLHEPKGTPAGQIRESTNRQSASPAPGPFIVANPAQASNSHCLGEYLGIQRQIEFRAVTEGGLLCIPPFAK